MCGFALHAVSGGMGHCLADEFQMTQGGVIIQKPYEKPLARKRERGRGEGVFSKG